MEITIQVAQVAQVVKMLNIYENNKIIKKC